MMDTYSVFDEKYIIPSRDSDAAHRLKLSSLFAYLQDTAGHHSEEIGTGLGVFEPRGIAWVLVRIRVDIHRAPHLFEKIIVKTWPLPGKTMWDRDFYIHSEEGELLVAASSTWIVMDLATREMIVKPVIDCKVKDFFLERAVGEPARRIRGSAELAPVYAKTVRYSDMDYNGHLNNTRYADLIMDVIPGDAIPEGSDSIDTISLNYLSELRLGSQAMISMAELPAPAEDRRLFEVSGHSEDGGLIFASQIRTIC